MNTNELIQVALIVIVVINGVVGILVTGLVVWMNFRVKSALTISTDTRDYTKKIEHSVNSERDAMKKELLKLQNIIRDLMVKRAAGPDVSADSLEQLQSEDPLKGTHER